MPVPKFQEQFVAVLKPLIQEQVDVLSEHIVNQLADVLVLHAMREIGEAVEQDILQELISRRTGEHGRHSCAAGRDGVHRGYGRSPGAHFLIGEQTVDMPMSHIVKVIIEGNMCIPQKRISAEAAEKVCRVVGPGRFPSTGHGTGEEEGVCPSRQVFPPYPLPPSSASLPLASTCSQWCVPCEVVFSRLSSASWSRSCACARIVGVPIRGGELDTTARGNF